MLMENVLSPLKDPMGQAIKDYYDGKKLGELVVSSSMFDDDIMPIPLLFRELNLMNSLEAKALELAKGRILDVGAGSGCHSIVLSDRGEDVEAIDISALSVEVMRRRGIAARQVSFFSANLEGKYDTILMMMNGIGIVGSVSNMDKFFNKAKELLNEGGQILLDSSDLQYLYLDDDGSCLVNLADGYYGEIDFQMEYKGVRSDEFNWLYIDFQTLAYYAERNGFKAELIESGEHYDYLARLTK